MRIYWDQYGIVCLDLEFIIFSICCVMVIWFEGFWGSLTEDDFFCGFYSSIYSIPNSHVLGLFIFIYTISFQLFTGWGKRCIPLPRYFLY
jgi:hypothetical protein